MQINVLLSSGDQDEWVGAADAVIDEGGLVIISSLDTEEVPDGVRVMAVSREIDNGPDLPPGTLTTLFRVDAIYAPGMWMKAEFSA